MGSFARQERFVIGIVVTGDQVGGLGIGTGQNDGGHAHHVCGKAGSDEFFAGLMCWYQNFATHVAAFLDSCQLVFEVHASRTRGNHVFHQFKRIEYAAKTCFSVCDDGQEEIDKVFAAWLDSTTPLDFVSAFESVVDAAHHGGNRVIGVQRLVWVHGF